jgi:membrane protein implicated in regulation of membrane protease activity
MQEWWEMLSTFEKVFWYIAIPFSVILLIQIILTFVGIGGASSDVGEGFTDVAGDGDIPEEIDLSDMAGPGFSFFTFRNFVAFFTVFGWAGIVGLKQGFSNVMVVLFAIICGLLIMLIISTLFYFISRLTDSGNLDIRNALNKIGKVYIPIKANSGNVGKIQLTVQDSTRELPAITYGEKDLPTGTVVKVTKIVSGNILVVEKPS